MVSQSENNEGQQPEEPKVGYPLSADIRIRPGFPEPSGTFTLCVIDVGNTGIRVIPVIYEADYGRKQEYWDFHFTPEAARIKIEDFRKKYALVYCYALDHLMQWFENPQVFQESDQMLTIPSIRTARNYGYEPFDLKLPRPVYLNM